jgi:hypothetical protein
MSNIPPISELSVRRFVGEKNYADGKKNFRLLKLGRIGEATNEAEQANNQELFKIADIFVKRGYRANAKRLMQERAINKDTTQVNDMLIQIWLNNHP